MEGPYSFGGEMTAAQIPRLGVPGGWAAVGGAGCASLGFSS